MNGLRKILYVITTLVVIGFIAFGYIGARMTILINGESYTSLRKQNHEFVTPEKLGINATLESFYTKDSLKLSYYKCKTSHPKSKGTVLLIHGIRSFKENFLTLGKMLTDSGYNAVALDLRAHGLSEGEYCTFGYYEKFDIKTLIDVLVKDSICTDKIGIWGHSLGAAVSLQAMSIDKRIDFGIIESGYSDYRTIIYDYAERTLGFRSELLFDYMLLWTEFLGDFKAEEMIPYKSCKNITQPVLVSHGEKDADINIRYGKKNYNNLNSRVKKFIAVPNATHNSIWKDGGDKYFKNVFSFIERNIAYEY